MTRLLSLVSAVFMLLGVSVLVALSPVKAQDSTPAALAAHPVVGLWRTTVTNTGAPPAISFTTFHADGTYLEVVQDPPIVVTGLWQPTGERTATVTAYNFFAIDDRPVEGEVRLTVTVDETGNALTEEGTVVGHYQDGSLALAVDSPATATRLQIQPVEPLGTPVLPGEAPAGTPAP
ncbi:MAG: hypothetical protein U0031_02550 [Thermomicrobiales bacterium]